MRLVELVPKKRGLHRCDQCGDTNGVREYFLPYTARSARKLERGRYRDLCQTCQKRIEGTPPDCITPETELAVYGAARHASPAIE